MQRSEIACAGYTSIAQADLFAVRLDHFATFHSFGATVATIVLAAFVVVSIVAIAIALVKEVSARGWWLTQVLRVDALTLQYSSFKINNRTTIYSVNVVFI